MNFLIRPAATGDVPEVALLMYLAGKSHVETSVYDLMFPGTMGHRLELMKKPRVTEARSWFHYSHYLVAEVDGGVSGSLRGYGEAEAGASALRGAFIEIGWGREEGRAWKRPARSGCRI